MAAPASLYRHCRAKPVPPQAARRSRQRLVSRSMTSASTAIMRRRGGPPAMPSRSFRCATSRRCGCCQSSMPGGRRRSSGGRSFGARVLQQIPRTSANDFTRACLRRGSASAKIPPPARPPRPSPVSVRMSLSLGNGEHRFVIEQGFEMGRPSLIELGRDHASTARLPRATVGGPPLSSPKVSSRFDALAPVRSGR